MRAPLGVYPAEGQQVTQTKVAGSLRSLARVKSTLELEKRSHEEHQKRGGHDSAIVEVALLEAFGEAHPSARGFRMGELQIIFEPIPDPGGTTNAHLSVSHPTR